MNEFRNSLEQFLLLFFMLEYVKSELLWSDRSLTLIKFSNMFVRVKLILEFEGRIGLDILF